MSVGFWWVLLAMGGYGLFHSLLACERPQLWARRRLGAAGRRWYRLVYNLLAGAGLLAILLMVRFLPDGILYRIPMPWALLTMGLQGASILAMLWVLADTGLLDFLGLAAQESQPPQLVTSGLYHYMRHPLYLGGLLAIWLMPMMTWNLLALCIGSTLYILVGIRLEERKLLRQFGKKYADYRKRTPMLIPFIKAPVKK